MEKIIDKIITDEKQKQDIKRYYFRKRASVDALVFFCRRFGFGSAENANPLKKAALVLCYAQKYTLPQYRELGISDNVFFDTMSDISIWCSNSSSNGLENIGWIKNHLRCELYRLGRLQFQMCRAGISPPKIRLPYSAGEKILNIHIPQGEPLLLDDCKDSVISARKFFGKYFPDFKYEYMSCTSWLLYGKNAEFMLPDSNIMRFASMFELAGDIEDDSQTIERVFGTRRTNINDYPENTSLRKNLKNYMLGGGKAGMGVGVIGC